MRDATPALAWAGALDAYEAALSDLTLGRATPAAFTPPAGLGPLPRSLAGRARALLARSLAAEVALAAHRDALAAEIRAPGSGARGSSTPGPRFVDTTA